MTISEYNRTISAIFNNAALFNGGEYQLATPEEQYEKDFNFLERAKKNPFFAKAFERN